VDADMSRVGLAEVLRGRRAEILEAWQRSVQSDASIRAGNVSAPHLRDHVPDLLDALIAALEHRTEGERAEAAHALSATLLPYSHAQERIIEGYSLGGVLRELAHLRTQILDVVWHSTQHDPGDVPALDELEFLHGALDECMTVSAVEMERASRGERERIVGVLGHDLRTPLNAVKMAGSLIARGQLPEQHTAFATKIVTAADRMNRMIADLLDFAAARSGGLKIERKPCDLRSVCQQVVDELRLAHRERAIDFEATGDAHGEWDEERIAQVVSNLGSNAIKYSPPESTIDIHLAGKDGCVDIAVHNVGEPISDEEQRDLFAPFKRGRKQSPTEGLGLGLFIAREMVRAHGGHIDLESERTRGTTFTAHLPR
jgi:signal transduction histidine kinase